jgi:Family of unknown function (DUF5719)
VSPLRFLPAAVVLVVVGAIGAVAVAVKPAPAVTAALVTRQVPISSAINACPPGTNGGQDRISLFAASSGSGSGSGSVTVSPLLQAGEQSVPARTGGAPSPGTLSLLSVPATSTASKQQGWSVGATGAMAQGMAAEIADSAGLGYVSCAEPGSDIWFAGPGQDSGAGQIQLDLMNVDDLAATVDVNIITDAGVAQAAGFSGITVAPHQLVTESLSSVASGSSVVAIEVRTSAGRVAAAVSEGSGHGTASWVPSTAAPSTSLIIPGIPPAGEASGLFLVVPGATDAKISITALTAQGSYQPVGSTNLPGESASDVPLTPLGGSAVALRITSNVPIVASVVVPGTGVGTFTTAADAIAQQAVIAGNTTAGGLTASLALTAPAGAAHVRVTETAAPGATTSQLVTVPAGRTVDASVATPPGAKRGTPFAVVITPLPGSGPLYAARVETQGQGTVVSIIPAGNAPSTISLPPVRDSYDAINP